jgi:hypothetical protein
VTADPAAAAWRACAAELRADVEHHIRHVFEWIDAELAGGGDDGAVVLLIAELDLDGGTPLSRVIADVLLYADADAPCPSGEDPSCRCGWCTYGRARTARAAASGR